MLCASSKLPTLALLPQGLSLRHPAFVQQESATKGYSVFGSTLTQAEEMLYCNQI